MEKVTLNQGVFQNLLENIPGMLYRCKFEPSWPILYVSKGSLDLTGYYPEELINARIEFANLIHPDDREWVWEHFTIQLSKKENCNCEYRLIAKDGKQKWVREIASGIFDDSGELLYIEGYIVDISEKKEHHKIISSLETHVNAINTNERRLRALLNAIPDTLIRINTNGTCFVYSSEAGINDHHNPDLEGDLAGFFPENIAHQLVLNAKKAIKTGKAITFEYDIVYDIQTKYFEARIVKSGEDEVITIIRDISETVKARQEKVKTRRFFQEIIDNTNAEIAVFDGNNKYKFISKSAIANETVREWIIDKDDFEYCKERGKSIEIAEKRMKMFRLVNDLKRPVDWVEEIKDAEGNSKHYVRTLNPFTFEDEQFKIGYGLDITALKVVQTELERREKLLSFSHEIAGIAYWVWYNNTECFEWSGSVYSILEVDKNEFKPSLCNYIQYVHPEDRARVADTIETAITTSSSFLIEYRIITPSGKLKYLKEQSNGDFQDSTTGKYVFGLIQDITDFYLSQAALAKKEDHFRAIAESSPVLILEVDRALRIKYINTLKVRKPEEVLGLTVFFFTHDDYKELFREKLEACFETGQMQRLQIMGQGAYSHLEWYEINIGPVKDKDGAIETLVLLAQNITKTKKSEKERDKLIKEVNHRYNELMQFNYIVSHNLRAPVANILGMVYLLNIGLPEEETKAMLADLVKAAESIDVLIKDLNGILAARSPLNEKKEHFVLKDVIQTILHDLETQINISEAVFEIDIRETDEVISIRSYIQSVLHHLISNAIKYKHPERKPHIIIKTQRDTDSTYITISDNGIGIDLEQYKDQVFGLYKRFTNSVEGKGLGLHMVKSQVESLGGDITIESKLEEGTTFKIRLNNI